MLQKLFLAGFSALALLNLSGCTNDSATYFIDDDRQHNITLMREQQAFWSKKIDLSIVVSRMPHCTRIHMLGYGVDSSKVELYQVPSGAYIVKLGQHLFATETETCEGWAEIKDLDENGEPPGGMGIFQGTFKEKNGDLIFERAKKESNINDKQNQQ